MDSELTERIKNRIEQHGDPADVDQLCLDTIEILRFTVPISVEIQRCVNLLYLTMNYCDLVSLEGLPVMPELVAFEAVGNQLKGVDIRFLLVCHNLYEIALDQNQIQDIEDLAPLNDLVNLENIQVRGNPLCLVEDYRSQIFKLIPKLKIVDCQDIFGDENLSGTQTESEVSDFNEEDESNDDFSGEEEEQKDEDEEFGDGGPHKFYPH